MSQESSAPPVSVPDEELEQEIRCATRKHHSAEDKVRTVPEEPDSEERIENIGK